jgi:hypothetical protein
VSRSDSCNGQAWYESTAYPVTDQGDPKEFAQL